MRLYILFSRRISLICVSCASAARIYVRKKCVPMALGSQLLWAANSAHRRFMGSFQESKRLTARGSYTVTGSLPMSVLGCTFTIPRLGEALAAQTPDVPQKVA